MGVAAVCPYDQLYVVLYIYSHMILVCFFVFLYVKLFAFFHDGPPCWLKEATNSRVASLSGRLPLNVVTVKRIGMPHVVLERIRNAPFTRLDAGKERAHAEPITRLDARAAYMIEGLELAANVIFVAGSACFWPAFAHDMDVFLLGCELFILGSFVYCCITVYTLCEAVHYHDNILNFESIEHVLYLLGSLLYLVGTVMYWPPEIDRYQLTWLAKHLSLGVYFNLFSTQFEGTILFMVGSAFFAFASFVNGLNQRSFDTFTNQLLTAVTSLYLGVGCVTQPPQPTSHLHRTKGVLHSGDSGII